MVEIKKSVIAVTDSNKHQNVLPNFHYILKTMKAIDNFEEGNNGNYHLTVKTQQELKEKSEPNGVFRPNGTKKATETSTNPFGNSNQSKQETTNSFEQTTLENTDPFAKNSTTIDIPDKDLPF